MNRHDRELLDRQMSRFQLSPRRDGVLILAMVGVFIAGLTSGGLLFTFVNTPSTTTASDDGSTAARQPLDEAARIRSRIIRR